ncbi:MAG: hypothetical protein QOG26_309 [Solirubrobacterales bacterium]|nr:hypothetical protein [Solirubrobacterales bacterium]
MSAVPHRGFTRGRRTRTLATLALMSSLIAIVAGVNGARAADSNTCESHPCVMLIQVDGLEAQDVTPQTTPFLWALAHPGTSGPDNPYGSHPALSPGRAGFLWQAARGPMQAGTAAATASLLTGGYPEQDAIPSDEFISTHSLNAGNHRLGAVNGENADVSTGDVVTGLKPLPLMIKDANPDNHTAAFVGDPALAHLVGEQGSDIDQSLYWTPAPYAPEGNPAPPSPDDAPPLLCPIPRNPDPSALPSSDAGLVGCPAPDAETLNNAQQKLQASSVAPAFTYIELAELGAVKRRTPHLDGGGAPVAPPAGLPTIPEALSTMDTALAQFFGGYTTNPPNSNTAARWPNTVVMLVGDHGYESTPLTNRVPNPAAANTDGEDLASYVSGGFGDPTKAGKFELKPQGTVATVYPASADFKDTASAPSADHRAAIQALKQKLETDVNQACVTQGGSECIQDVLYMRPQLAARSDGPHLDDPSILSNKHPCSEPPTPAEGKPTLPCSSWHLDSIDFDADRDPSGPTGISGDLLVVLKPSWATGKAVPTQAELTEQADNAITNPYLASPGGPRNRAIAAIINGPTTLKGEAQAKGVRQVAAGSYYPVFNSDPPGGQIGPFCRDSQAEHDAPKFPANDVTAANADPSDDTEAVGHNCQAELVDFAPSIASLLRVSMNAEQIAGRPLNEAFVNDLANPCQECIPQIPVLHWADGPVTPPKPGELPEIASSKATFSWVSDEPTATFECAFDAGKPGGHDFEPCHDVAGRMESWRAYTVNGLKRGVHTIEVRGTSKGCGFPSCVGQPITADFKVVPFFDYQGLLRRLRAYVTDRHGRPMKSTPDLRDKHDEKRVKPAPRGSLMDHVDIRGDFGRPFSQVQISLYNRPRLPGGGCNQKGQCVLKTLAKFAPFKIARGPVELLFKIPKKSFNGSRKPTHIGITVKEQELLHASPKHVSYCQKHITSKRCKFKSVGHSTGTIVSIHNASSLYKTKR